MIVSTPFSTEPLIPIKSVVVQAPPIQTVPTDIPVTAIGVIGQPVGTSVYSIDPASIRPIVEVPPLVATLGRNQTGTTSKQNPDAPAPVPPVGSFPKPSGVMPIGNNLAAPTAVNTRRMLGFIVAGILLAWFFLGFSFRSVL